jgi:glycosyltransferase involved in cell wall biosynthesis
VRAVKHIILRYFFSLCDAFLTIGDNNEKYYLHYGVPAHKLFRGACPVDVGRFLASLKRPDRPTRSVVKRRLGIPENMLAAVVSGKLIPIKRQVDLIKAIALLREKDISCFALIIGDGPCRQDLEACAEHYGVSDRVKITGFINQQDMPFFIEAGDIAVIPSEKDPHPLAVTEALVLGLPVVASDKVGCVGRTDTARPGENAIVYPCGDIAALAEALALLARDPALRERLGRASLDIAPTQDVTAAARAVVRILLSLRQKFSKAWDGIDKRFVQFLNEYLSHG